MTTPLEIIDRMTVLRDQYWKTGSPAGRIRNERGECPLCALANHVLGANVYGTGVGSSVWRVLGIDEEISLCVVFAADNSGIGPRNLEAAQTHDQSARSAAMSDLAAARLVIERMAVLREQGWTCDGGVIRNEYGECPLCALANHILGANIHKIDVGPVVRDILGIEEYVSRVLMFAADNSTASHRSAELRRSMIRTLKAKTRWT